MVVHNQGLHTISVSASEMTTDRENNNKSVKSIAIGKLDTSPSVQVS